MNGKVMRKVVFSVFAGLFCGFLTLEAAPAAPAVPATPAAPLVTLGEFSKARLVHVTAYAHKAVALNGSCYIADNTKTTVVYAILKKAHRLNNLKIAQDQKSADYTLNATIDRQLSGRRTVITLKTTFTNNKTNEMIWSASSTVSSRGNIPASEYAASLAGAAVYYFQRYSTTSAVSKRMLMAFYPRLAAAGE